MKPRSRGALARLVRPASALALTICLLSVSAALARPAGDAAPPRETVAVVEAGDTLEALLRDVGFDGVLRKRIILGFRAEFDPRSCGPGTA